MGKHAILAACLLIAAFSFACGRKERNIIDKQKMVSIMIDLHKVDGIILSELFLKNYPRADSVDIYNPVFEKHEVTRRQFEESLLFYSQSPQILEKMYDKVISELTKEHTRLKEEIAAAARDTTGNLWKERTNWKFPAERNDNFEVKIPLKGLGLYTFSSQIRLYRNDESENSRISLWFWADNGTEVGKTDSFPITYLKKDGKLHFYKVSKHLSDTSYTHLRGRLLDSDLTDSRSRRQADFFQIRITFEDVLSEGVKHDIGQ